MTTDEALAFLRAHQPMPADQHLTRELIQQYEEAREVFLENHDVRCIPLFLNSFGEGSGLGVYQLVEDVVRIHSPSDVVPHLAGALASKRQSVRYWCAQIAEFFPTPDLIGPLAILLADNSFDVRSAAITALAGMKDERARLVLREALDRETDPEIRNLIVETLQNR